MISQHKLFQDFPIDGSTNLSVGQSPTPYHVYQGHGTLITGTADLNAVKSKTEDESVYPVRTKSGHAAMGIFVCDFENASHGSHLELQVCVLVSEDPGCRISDDPFAMLAAMVAHPEWGTLCLHLWNDTSNVVAYNSEYLGLNASLATGQISREDGRKTFEFTDKNTGTILNGDVSERRRSSFKSLIQFTRAAGIFPTMRANARPYFENNVINLKGSVFQDNRRARTFTAPDQMVLQHFDMAKDVLNLQGGGLSIYDFQPLCLEHLAPFRFVYLHPDQSV